MSVSIKAHLAPQSQWGKSLTRLLAMASFGSCGILAIRPLATLIQSISVSQKYLAVAQMLLLATAAMATVIFMRRIISVVDAIALAQSRFIEGFSASHADAAILLSASLSLFLELGMIRWQSSVLPFIALYKNFSLLACFAGLGLGYALAMKDRIALVIVLPLLAWQFGLLVFVRYELDEKFTINPFSEQLAMGIGQSKAPKIILCYWILTVVFLLTALTFMPIGQLCGRLMERRAKLRAYGFNLLGSLLGVVLMLVASFLWTPPIVWFSLSILAILLFTSRTPVAITVGVSFAMVCVMILAWPVDPTFNRVYSPYQLLEIGTDAQTGVNYVRAAGQYYQRILDLAAGQNSRWDFIRTYYDFPYKVHPKLDDVAIVGAGTGNDVAAALRSGVGHVEAIEIDPAIQFIGQSSHPERPYSDPRVHAEINDARSFLRNTGQKFDLLVYGLLDSHTLLSQGSSVRVDSFVYTVEGLREARARLKSDGVLSLSFAMISDGIGRKIYLMLQQAFDGTPPICVQAEYDGAVIFLESNDPKWSPPAKLIEDSGFTSKTAFFADPSIPADVSTDDWPFFYMPRRIYPVTYLVMVLLVLALSFFVTFNFVRERPQFSHLSLFFLGAGFMLIETKGITEMGLTFGNTWQVIGIVIAGVLIMAFLGNCIVQWMGLRRPLAWYPLLLVALMVGWLVARSGGFPSTHLGRFETTIVLTLPMVFSGIIFSTLLAGKGSVSAMMAMNLLGAICGGLLEYNSMYFGFQFLYLMAIGCYLLALLSNFVSAKRLMSNEASSG